MSTLRRGKPMRRVSAKKALADAEYQVAREQRRRQVSGQCEGHTLACPPGPHMGHHAHHVARRSQGGAHQVENLRWLCWEAHEWVHANPHAAAEVGLLARRA